MDDINLTDCEDISRQELIDGLDKCRRARDLARDFAARVEDENAQLRESLLKAHMVNAALGAKLTAHGIEWPTHDDIEGTPI